MRVIIEKYRDWEIFFDTDSENFYTVSSKYDRQETKRSYASAKKTIDDYIKDNSVFKPVKVQRMSSLYSPAEVITLIGIRKDNAFMYEDKDGNKRLLSEHTERDYFLVDSKNDIYFEQIEELTVERKKQDKKFAEIEKNIIKVTVKQMRQNEKS